MSNDLYVVTGATGNIGRELVRILLSKGMKVRAVARNAAKLDALKGAEPFAASLDDGAALGRAFSGAAGVFTMIPPNYAAPDFRAYQNKISEALAAGIRAAQVKFVVNLSSMGAQLEAGTGPILGARDGELRFNALEADVVHLRPAYFMENHLGSAGLVKSQGINGGGMKADVAIPMIATKDIAAAAGELMAKGGARGKTVRELLGPADRTMAEATAVFGKAVGKPDLPYVQFPEAGVKQALTGMGFSDDVARSFLDMIRGFNERVIKPVAPRGPESATPTSLEDFAPVFAAAYRGA